MKYVSVAEMVAIENEADSKGHSYSQMMELAGKGLAEVVNTTTNKEKKHSILGLVGPGNNGGDTLVALSYLQAWGWQTTAYLVRERPLDDPLVRRAKDSGCLVLNIAEDQQFITLKAVLKMNKVLMDGVLGTGVQLPLRGNAAAVLSLIKEELKNNQNIDKWVVAVDCPSGVNCDSGEAAPEAFSADITVTMAAVKQGLLKFPAYNLVGELRCVDIGISPSLEHYAMIKRDVIDRQWARSLLPDRPLQAHKSTFGVIMVVAGSIHYSGAVILAGQAAFRSGAGWVTLAVPKPLHRALAGRFIEATWLPLPHQHGWIAERASSIVLENLDRVNTMILGPGFGLDRTTFSFIENLLSKGNGRLPDLVIDADGLKMLSQIPDWQQMLPERTVLTPHPGEMSVLTGKPVDEIVNNRLAIAEYYAQKWGHIVVLKGAFTIIASPEGRTAILPVATPALARAGTGDVLAGLIGGFWAQGVRGFQAAVLGSWIHAQAGLKAAIDHGNSASVLAGDVLESIKDVLGKT